MGNREALLIGAKRSLLEKGYAGSTARDIASAAGVSLAAIGYHFRTKEALLTEALLDAFADWDREFRQALSVVIPGNATAAERFELIWDRLIKTFETHRSLWMANFELFAQMDAKPEIRQILQNNIQFARSGLAALFLGAEETAISKRTAQTTGTFHHVLLSGMITQWLVDPKHTLSAQDLTACLLSVAAGLQTEKRPAKQKRQLRRPSRSPG
jgi:AcrR family transcriptional regulator